MKALVALLALAAIPAQACDWKVTEKVDPMTDRKTCTITSPTARLGIGVTNKAVTFASASPYPRDYLTIRVDDQTAILLGYRARSTDAFEGDARQVLAQIRSGSRIRVQWRSYEATVNGDAPICDLPQIIDSCL